MKVIDVSAWQIGINWDEVVADGVEGVIIKISEGTRIDNSFYTHLQQAELKRLKIGVYCFSHATTTAEGEAEANEVVYILQSHDIKVELGIWFDVESDAILNCPDPMAVSSAFIAFCNQHGYVAGIYTSLSTFTDVLKINQLADYVPYWCAQYNSVCNFKDYYPDKVLAGWQYSDSLHIGNMNVDMNEWYI